MQRKFLQEKSISASMGNAEKSLNIDLSSKSKLIPYSTAADMLGLNDLYLEERNACENYRMIFTVSPICTNALYNAVTEPVFKEGSSAATSLVESSITRDDEKFFPNGTLNLSGGTGGTVDQVAAVRDTEYSHPKIGDFKYHCGYDIFNNHLLRTDEFEHVKIGTMKVDGTEYSNRTRFNTIFDFAVDYSGTPIFRILTERPELLTGDTMVSQNVPLYQLDTIKTINTAFYDDLRSVDGWYGFYNTGYINIPNGTLKEGNEDVEISVNRVLNNESPCGFIDLYPVRTLYSFIPKVNRFRRRLERNWDCTIVYPYENDYDTFNRVMLGFSGTSEEWEDWKEENPAKVPNAVKVLETKVLYNNVGDEIIQMKSLLRHTLQPGDTIRLFYTYEDTGGTVDIIRFSMPVTVISVGDTKGNEKDRYFTIKLFDISTFCGVMEEEATETEDDEEDDKPEPKLGLKNIKKEGDDFVVTFGPELFFYYRKVESGYDDRYYFRKFKQLKNYEYVQVKEDTGLTPTRVIKEPSVINEDSPEYIVLGTDYFKKIERPLSYSQNKLAFGQNIYGDRVAQVIFTDDICISGLKDNLGRPLSSVYFMAEKTNRGHEEWYSGITSAETIEYSHCFSDVTSGLDLPADSGATDFNVRKLHNVFSAQCQEEEYKDGLMIMLQDVPVGSYSGTPMPLESALTLDDYDEFYGDIVEFNKANFTETTIERVYHRFNTAQRECLTNKKYFDIHYDDLVGDIYDVKEITETTGN